MKTIADAILAINPEAVFRVTSDAPYAVANAVDAEITWLEGTSEISKADIQTKLDELRTS